MLEAHFQRRRGVGVEQHILIKTNPKLQIGNAEAETEDAEKHLSD